MNPRKNHILIFSVILSGIFLAALAGITRAEEKEWVFFHKDLSGEIKRITIPLSFTASEAIFYESSIRQIRSQEIQGKGKKDDYTQQLDFGAAADGCQYLVQIRETDDINIIDRGSDRLCAVKILRIAGTGKPILVKEGFCFLQREIEIPLEMSSTQLGVSTKDSVAGIATIQIHRNNPPVYEGHFNVQIRGTLAGSTSIENALINTSVTSRNSLDMKDRNVTIAVKPFNDQMAAISVNGKVSDILMAGSAKLVVEKIASDSSEMVLAVLNGDLVQEKKPGSTLEIGKAFPEFARVDLVNRRFLTFSDIRKNAGTDGHIVLIFGDFKRTPSMPGYYDPRAQTKNLSLDDAMIVNTLFKDIDKPVLVVFISQQLSLADLYEKWLDRDLDFCVLSEFSNPLDVQYIIQGMEQFGGYGYRRPDRGESLRGQLGLPNDTVITTLINGRGELVYMNANAGKELSGSLVQINNLMKEPKTTEK